MRAQSVAASVVKTALLFATIAVFACAAWMSRLGCPSCLSEFANNGVNLDVMALELPARGSELTSTLNLGKPVSADVRAIYETQTRADDLFLWLYAAQFVLACLYFSLRSKEKACWALCAVAGVIMVLAGVLDHRENGYIHAILRDPGGKFDQLAIAVKHVSTQKWICFAVASFLAAVALSIHSLSDLRMPSVRTEALRTNATRGYCATLTLVSALVVTGLARDDRAVVGWSASAYAVFLLLLLWALYLEPIANTLDSWLRRTLGLDIRANSNSDLQS